MTKVIIVSPSEFHEYFSSVYPEWDLQHVVADLDQMWEDLGSGILSDQSEIVILNDAYYTEDNTDLESAIATFAPAALVVVLSYDKEIEQKIISNVKEICKANNYEEAPYYFAHEETPIGDINAAIEDWNKRKNAPASTNPVSDGKQLADKKPEFSLSKAKAEKGPILTNKDLPAIGDGRGIIIASTSSKGGSGKTTVALCTATMLYHASRLAAEQGLRDKPMSVCVVDMDVRDGQIGFLLNQLKPTILNLYIDDKNPDAKAIEAKLIQHEGMGIYALLAPKFGRTASVIKNEFYQDVIFKLSTMFDVVILDTSVNYLDKLLGEVVLPLADQILFVTNLSKGSIYGMTRWMQEMVANKDVETHIDAGKVGVVINQAMADVGVNLELITKQAMDVPLLAAIPSDSNAVVKATNTYRLHELVLRHPDISNEYFRLAKKIIDLIPTDDAIIVSPQMGTVYARPELKAKLMSGEKVATPVSKEIEKEEVKEEVEYVAPAKRGGLFK